MLLRMRKAIKRILKKEGKEKEKWMAVLKQACKLQIATIQKKKIKVANFNPPAVKLELRTIQLKAFFLFTFQPN